MTERVRSASAGYPSPKMENDLSPRKTLLVLVIVVGCFAVLWPKVFYPMIMGSANQHIKPSPIDKTTGCCDVISETDVNTIKIMNELCGTIIKSTEDKPLSGKEIVQRCRKEVLETCGIDISVVLQEQVRLGQSVKQILDEIRSLNGSLCLKYNFGVSPWRLGVPHRIMVKTASDAPYLRQERPHHLRSELIHPAFRERGRAIPQPQAAPVTRPPPRVVEGRPGPIPGMRPTLGGAGHVVPPSKQGTSSMSVIMPIYTIGIVIFFTYTLMRIIFKKQPEGVGGALYPPVEPDPHFRKEVFESEASRLGPRLTRENISSKLVVNAMSALLDEVDQEIEARRKSSEVASQDLVNGTLSNGDVVKPQDEQPTVKVLGMEMTASCEGGKKWSRPDSPVLPTSPPPPPAEPVPPPQEIYLEGALPAQSHLLVSDSATEPEPLTGEDPAVVLSGKMTLSVISLDSENGDETNIEPAEEPVPEIKSVAQLKEDIEEAIREEPVVQETQQESAAKTEEKPQDNEPEFEIEDYVLEPIIMKKFEVPPASRIEIEDIEKKLQENSQSAVVIESKVENELPKPPLIQLESEETPHSVKVEELEREVDELIKEAVETIEHKQPISLEILQNLNLKTNEINDDLEEKIENEKNNIEMNQDQPTLSVEEGKLAVEELKPNISLNSNETENFIEKIEASSVVESSDVIPEKVEEKIKSFEETENSNNKTIEETIQQSAEDALKLGAEAVIEAINEEISRKDVVEENIKESSEVKPSSEVVEEAEKTKIGVVEITKPRDTVSEKNEETPNTKEEEKPVPSKPVEIETKPSDTVFERNEETPSPKEEEKSKPREPVEIVDDDELGSEEEIVEEIEEIVYESSEEEESELESEEEVAVERNTNKTDSSPVQKINGEKSEDAVEESKYTTVSGATAAENDISDEELTDNEEVDDEEEIIEVEEIEDEDEDYIVEEDNHVNHVAGESEPEP